MLHVNFPKILYNCEALKFSLLFKFYCFYDKSTINAFVISGRFSEKYWILSNLSAFSQASKLLKHKQMKILLKLRLENIKLKFRAITLRFVNPNLSQIEHKIASEK